MKVYAKRSGNVVTVFEDNGQLLPISSYDDEPVGFPLTTSPGALEAKYGKENVIYVEKARPPQYEAGSIVNQVTPGGAPVQDGRAKLDLDAMASKELRETPQTLILPPAAGQAALEQLMQRVLGELQAMFINWHSNQDAQDKQDLEAVCSFLLVIEPALLPIIEKMKEPPQRKRFSL